MRHRADWPAQSRAVRLPPANAGSVLASRLGASHGQYLVELATPGEFGQRLAFPHRDIIRAVVAEHALRALLSPNERPLRISRSGRSAPGIAPREVNGRGLWRSRGS